MRKRLVAAAAFAVFSTLVSAENGSRTIEAGTPVSRAVPMTDAELDQVTAAAAQHRHGIINPGGVVIQGDPFSATDNFLCVNCLGSGPRPGPAGSVHFIVNRGHDLPVTRCLGSLAALC